MARLRPNERVSCRDDVLRRIIIIIMISKLPHFEYNQHSAPAAARARVLLCKCAQINCWQIFPLWCRCAGVLVDGCSGNFAKLELELRPAVECSAATGNTSAFIVYMHIRARIKGASHRRWRSLSWKSFIKQAVYEKEIRNRILRVVLYVLYYCSTLCRFRDCLALFVLQNAA